MVEIVLMLMEEWFKNIFIVKKYFIYYRLNVGVFIIFWLYMGCGWGLGDVWNILMVWYY